MPLERFHKLPEARQQALLHAARTEFVEHGFEKASLNRIIASARISKGSLYYYFADKGDLFGAVVEAEVTALFAQVGPPDAASDADGYWRALFAWGKSLTDALFERPELSALGPSFYGAAGAEGSVARLRQQLHARVSAFLERGQALGAVRSDLPVGMLATGLTHLLLGVDRYMAEHFATFAPDEARALSAKVFELCRDLAAPRRP